MKTIKITKEFLLANNACEEGLSWFMAQRATSLEIVINKLIKQKHFDWANWTIVRFMSHEQSVHYACFAARRSLKNFERAFPGDKRPHKAIEAALRWVDNPMEENRSAAKSAAYAASASASAAYSAYSAAYSASASAAKSAAESAAYSAYSAAYSASAARSAAESAAYSAAYAARSFTWETILLYGIKLLLKRGLK